MTATIDINKKVEVSDGFLSSIICTAVEGGIGYWSQVSDYHWNDPVMDGKPHFAEVTIYDMQDLDDDEAETYSKSTHLTMDMIAEALRKIASDEEIEYCGQSWRNRMVDAMIEDEAGDIDSGDADNIVQIAIFGNKLVYG